MKKHLTFRKFDTYEEANAVLELLSKHSIHGKIEEERPLLDAHIIGQQFEQPYCLKLDPEDFTKADELLRSSIDLNAVEADDDYYLLNFSDEELMDVIRKKDEWGHYDYALALKLLKGRGIDLSVEEIRQAGRERVAVLSKAEKGSGIWIMAGYLIAVVGGLLGFFIGIFLLATRKTLPDGTRVRAFDAASRAHGWVITVISFVAMPAWVAYMFYFERMPPGIHSIFGASAMIEL